MNATDIVELLGQYEFRHTNEADLQRAIEQIFRAEGVPFEREVVLNRQDRIDFMVDGCVGVEVKVAGSSAKAARQIQRYAKCDRIEELVLVTSRMQAGQQLESYMGKPCEVFFIMGGIG